MVGDYTLADLEVGQTVEFEHSASGCSVSTGIIRFKDSYGLAVEVTHPSSSVWCGHNADGHVPNERGWWVGAEEVICILDDVGNAYRQIEDSALELILGDGIDG